MSQFVETIKFLHGKAFNLEYHQQRFDWTRKNNYSGSSIAHLSNEIQVPDKYRKGLVKCRVIYSDTIHHIEFSDQVHREVKSLRIIESDHIEYPYKSTDRTQLARLFAKRGTCDDILIIKNKHLTDSYIANVILFDGDTWWTPDTPLLKGTQRMRLLDEAKIKTRNIRVDQLDQFSQIGLINSFWGLDNMPIIARGSVITE